MRKVTASAVILTAVTGCSQSKAPSATWSFEPPTTEAETFIADSPYQFDSAAVTSLSPAAQRFLDATGVDPHKEMMGPAFEQPDTFANDSTDSIELTPQVAIPLQTRPRTDPIAEVRSYLSRTQNTSFLGDRVPYSTQIPLPTAPDYTTSIYSQQTAATFSESLPAPAFSGRSESASQTGIDRNNLLAMTTSVAPPNDAAQAIADINQPPVQFSTPDLSTATAQPPRLTSFGVDSFAPTELAPGETVTTSTSQVGSAPIFEATDGETLSAPSRRESLTTPQLVSEDLVVSPLEDQVTRDESVPIGTAILSNLRQGSDVEAAEALIVEDFSVEEDAAQSVNESFSDESLSVANSTTSTAIEPMLISERLPIDDKLARLLQTLPARSLADSSTTPLISHSQSDQPGYQTFVEEMPTEDAVDLSSNLTDEVTNHSDELTSPPSGSLLLKGLEDVLDDGLEGFSEPTDVLQTLYLPIPGTPTVSASTTFIQTALTTLERSARGANTVATPTAASNSDANRPDQAMQTGRLGSGQAVSYRVPASAKRAEDTSQRTSQKRSQQRPAKYRQRIVWR